MPRISRELDVARTDELLERLRRGQGDDGEAENTLLQAFHAGYPLTRLLDLLRAEDARAVAAGVWIAAELGPAARPIFGEMVGLLTHSQYQVRFFVLDYLTSCARPGDAAAIINALDLIEDPHSGVVWKTLLLLARLPSALLADVAQEVTVRAPFTPRARGLRLVADSPAPDTGGRIEAGLVDRDELIRRFAVAAAARIADSDPTPLRHAISSPDVVVKQFAEDIAELSGLSLSKRSDLQG